MPEDRIRGKKPRSIRGGAFRRYFDFDLSRYSSRRIRRARSSMSSNRQRMPSGSSWRALMFHSLDAGRQGKAAHAVNITSQTVQTDPCFPCLPVLQGYFHGHGACATGRGFPVFLVEFPAVFTTGPRVGVKKPRGPGNQFFLSSSSPMRATC